MVIKRIGEVVAIQWLILPWVADCLTGTWVLNCYLSSIKVEEENPAGLLLPTTAAPCYPTNSIYTHTHLQSMVTTKTEIIKINWNI